MAYNRSSNLKKTSEKKNAKKKVAIFLDPNDKEDAFLLKVLDNSGKGKTALIRDALILFLKENPDRVPDEESIMVLGDFIIQNEKSQRGNNYLAPPKIVKVIQEVQSEPTKTVSPEQVEILMAKIEELIANGQLVSPKSQNQQEHISEEEVKETQTEKKIVEIDFNPDDQVSTEEEVEVPDDIMSALEDFLF